MIYFLQRPSGGPIKIGFTAGPLPIRLRVHEAEYATRFSVLGVMDGDRIVEQDVHRRFSSIRLWRRKRRVQLIEYFQPTEDLLRFIEENAKPWVIEPKPTPTLSSAPPESARLDSEALRVARIVAAYRGVSLAEYLSEIVLEKATSDLAIEQSRGPLPTKPTRRSK